GQAAPYLPRHSNADAGARVHHFNNGNRRADGVTGSGGGEQDHRHVAAGSDHLGYVQGFSSADAEDVVGGILQHLPFQPVDGVQRVAFAGQDVDLSRLGPDGVPDHSGQVEGVVAPADQKHLFVLQPFVHRGLREEGDGAVFDDQMDGNANFVCQWNHSVLIQHGCGHFAGGFQVVEVVDFDPGISAGVHADDGDGVGTSIVYVLIPGIGVAGFDHLPGRAVKDFQIGLGQFRNPDVFPV